MTGGFVVVAPKKMDLEDKYKHTYDEIVRFFQKKQLKVHSTFAKSGYDVTEVFEAIFDKIIEYDPPPEMINTPVVDEPKTSEKSKCCQ
jgi:hypothetical protein